MKQIKVALVAGLFVFAAEAAEYFVDDDNYGKSGMTGATEELAFGTLQEGIDAATQEGDIVTVLPGEYSQGGKADATGAIARGLIGTCKIILRGTAGHRDDTVILGERGEESNYLGTKAVRCLYIAEAANGSIIKGLTLRRGTSPTGGLGGGVCYAKDRDFGVWVSGCAFEDCLANRGGAAARVNVHRCLFTDNHAADNASCGYQLGKITQCVFSGNYLKSLLYYCTDIVLNCTFYYNTKWFFYTGCYGAKMYNCLALRNSDELSPTSTTYVDEIRNYVTDRKDENSKRKEGADNLFEQETYQLFAPAFDDFRLVDGAAALTAGSADLLTSVTLPPELENLDYAGNSLEGLTGTIAAGAVQGPAVCPHSGRIQLYAYSRSSDYSENLRGYFTTVNGKWILDGHAYFDTWPVQIELIVNAPVRKIWGVSSSGATSRYLFPPKTGRIHFLPPPPTAEKERAMKVVLADDELKVDPTGADGAYSTLQAAVDAATANYTYIEAAAGEYRTGGAVLNGLMNRVAIDSKKIRLVGAGRGKSFIIGAPDPDTDDGVGAGATRCVAMNLHEAEVEGFTLTGGFTGLNESPTTASSASVAGFCGTNIDKHYLVDSEITAVTGAYCVAAARVEMLRCTVHDIVATGRGMFNTVRLNACRGERFTAPKSTEWAASHINSDCATYFSTFVGDKNHMIMRPYVNSYFSIYHTSYKVDLRTGYKTYGVIYCNCGNIDNQSGAVYTTDDPKFKDLAGGDYHVREDSPVIDAFDGSEVWSKIWNYIDTDYDGNPIRIVNGSGTCGCYQTDFFPRLGLILIFK